MSEILDIVNLPWATYKEFVYSYFPQHFIFLYSPVISVLAILCYKNPSRFFGYRTASAAEEDFKTNTQKNFLEHHRMIADKWERLENKQKQYPRAIDKSLAILAKVFNQESMSLKGFDRCLLLAFLYPCLFFLLSWVINGEAVHLDNVEVLREISIWHQVIAGSLLFAIVFIWVMYFRTQKKFFYLLLVLSCLLFFSTSQYFEYRAFASTIALAFAFAFIRVGAGAIAVVSAYAIISAYFDAVDNTINVYGAISLTILVAATFSYTFSDAITDYDSKSSSKGVKIKIGYVLFLLVYLIIISGLLLSTEHTYEPKVILTFLALLPFLNAISDWCSVSVTQYLLTQYRFKKNRVWIYVLKDLFAALFLIVLLYCLIGSLFWLLDYARLGLNLSEQFHTFRHDPFDPSVLWLGLLIITNLIPTFIHLAIFMYGVLLGWRTPAQEELETWKETLNKGDSLGDVDALALSQYLYLTRYVVFFILLGVAPHVLYIAYWLIMKALTIIPVAI